MNKAPPLLCQSPSVISIVSPLFPLAYHLCVHAYIHTHTHTLSLFPPLVLAFSPQSHHQLPRISWQSCAPVKIVTCSRINDPQTTTSPPFKHLRFHFGKRTHLRSRTHGLAKPLISTLYRWAHAIQWGRQLLTQHWVVFISNQCWDSPQHGKL